MLIDMIHDNHGELPFKTRYRDPEVLRGMGYEAIVIPEALAALPGAYPQGGAAARAPELRGAMHVLKPGDVEESIDQQVRAAKGSGLEVFFYGDALLLPRVVVEKQPGAYLCEDAAGSAGGPGVKLCPGKPAVFAAMQDQLRELFDRWPEAAGVVMRTGEVYPEATPHMIGSPLHAGMCPVCRPIALQDRLVKFIGMMHEVVSGELNKMYVHRAWQPAIPGLPNMHDDPATYLGISGKLPASGQLAFSFKFTRGDFRMDTSFNACLLADDRPKWIEFQCEREYEGKGAFPNYQAPVWQQFLERLSKDGKVSGGSAGQLRSRFSLWGWSRGGGWGGPYVQREEWIDANVNALAVLFRSPEMAVTDIATAWTSATFGVAESAPPTPAITELLLTSGATIRKLLYVSVANGAVRAPWIKDDLLDVEAIWASAQQVVDSGKAEEACVEKAEAMRGADRLRHLFDLASPELPNKSQVRALANSLAYFSSFAGAVVNLFVGFVRYTQWTRGGKGDTALAEKAADALEHAQAHWQHHTQRHALLPGAPSVFQENTLWDRTNDCLEQLQVVG